MYGGEGELEESEGFEAAERVLVRRCLLSRKTERCAREFPVSDSGH